MTFLPQTKRTVFLYVVSTSPEPTMVLTKGRQPKVCFLPMFNSRRCRRRTATPTAPAEPPGLEHLEVLRQTMERSSGLTVVPGWGLCALTRISPLGPVYMKRGVLKSVAYSSISNPRGTLSCASLGRPTTFGELLTVGVA